MLVGRNTLGRIRHLTVRGKQHDRLQTSWNRNDNCGLLVGATYPSQIRQVRAAAPSLPLLIAGVGWQHGALRDAVTAAATTTGGGIVSASRSITHASTGPDFATAARHAPPSRCTTRSPTTSHHIWVPISNPLAGQTDVRSRAFARGLHQSSWMACRRWCGGLTRACAIDPALLRTCQRGTEGTRFR